MNVKNKKKIIFLETVLFLLLVSSYIVIDYRNIIFKKDCKIEYNLTEPCPCEQNNYKNDIYFPINMNLYNPINMNLYNPINK